MANELGFITQLTRCASMWKPEVPCSPVLIPRPPRYCPSTQLLSLISVSGVVWYNFIRYNIPIYRNTIEALREKPWTANFLYIEVLITILTIISKFGKFTLTITFSSKVRKLNKSFRERPLFLEWNIIMFRAFLSNLISLLRTFWPKNCRGRWKDWPLTAGGLASQSLEIRPTKHQHSTVLPRVKSETLY